LGTVIISCTVPEETQNLH